MSLVIAVARRAGAAIFLSLVAASSATAGSISLRWAPVVDPPATGYTISYGTAAGVYASQQDAGQATTATIGYLAECTTWYVAVKSYDATGNESPVFSNEVSGWPAPSISQTFPDHADQGLRLTVLVTGVNFQEGASLHFSDPAIVVHSTAVDSCRGITADVTIGYGAVPGLVDVEVLNPDTVHGFGRGAFRVERAIAPGVASTDPPDGAQAVDPGVSPRIVFSEAMLPSSIGPETVRLLAPDGTAVPQAPGSPTLSADGLVAVLTPASRLTYDTTYRTEVVGGAAGVLDLSGLGMSATDRQAIGFTVASDLAGPVLTDVRAESVDPTGASILWTTDEPATSQVAWRRVGDPEYATTEVDPALVDSHEVRLWGLTPGIAYEYHARSADLSANPSQSSPDQTFTTVLCGSDAGCDDGLFCNGIERCALDSGLCLPGEPIACTPPQQCDETGDACAQPEPEATPLPIVAGMAWHLFQGATEPPSDWNSLDFDDSAWSEGPSGFGYGQDCAALHATTLNAMHGAAPSLYVRRPFHVDDPASVGSLALTVDYDAGFVAYLNGVEVARRNLAGDPPAHDATALGPHGCSGAASDPHAPDVILLDAALLRPGTNVLALQGHEEAGGKAFTLAVELAAGEGP